MDTSIVDITPTEIKTFNIWGQFIADNNQRILENILKHNNNYLFINSSLYFVVSKTYNYIDYQHNKYSLINNSLAKIIKHHKSSKGLETISPPTEDPSFNNQQTKKILNSSIQYNAITIRKINEFLKTKRKRFAIVEITLWCSFDNDSYFPFENNHSNIMIIDNLTKTFTLIDPHGIQTHSRKSFSFSNEINRNLHTPLTFKPNYQFADISFPNEYTKNIQGNDLLCSAWICFMTNSIIKRNEHLIFNPYLSKVKLLQMINSISKNKTYQRIIANTNYIDTLYDKKIQFVPIRYIKLFKLHTSI